MEQHSGTGCACSEWRFSLLNMCDCSHFSVLLSLGKFNYHNHEASKLNVESKPIIKV